jgi:GxxExxY protein
LGEIYIFATLFYFLILNMQAMLQRKDLLYPELSYRILGCAFSVFSEIGHGHLEKVYQRAIAKSFSEKGIKFTEQTFNQLTYKGERILTGYVDFLVEDKVVVELKRGRFSYPKELDQTLQYLKTTGLQLAIIIRFTPDGVHYKRVVNQAGYKKSA